ncbi:S-adenosyl-L-methionine-dependent methyltransferase [Coprinopsis marcescibilis]|uniref:tRNA (cytosine(38)-C(5))-methyltransferase n=1 Tax=Coprinopsis marcescibilis TaxID=230819 RepID=A0A5C3KNM2_COPMA|nr:S-adenosyl-L-methionine-dependent methyltransferase [Coprinopsis marcescibilis]
MRALEFYSGVGGMHFALSRVNLDITLARAFDWDQTACKVYSANHGPGVVERLDIASLTVEKLDSYDANIWLLSPACQPYTVLNPNAKGAEDPRAQSYLYLLQTVLPGLARMPSSDGSGRHPGFILVENVAGFEGSTTRQIQLNVLKELGYYVMELLLTPLQFGIPNSRLRYYLLAKKTPFQPSVDGELGVPGGIWRHIPGRPAEWREDNVDEIRSYLDERPVPSANRVPEKVLVKWGRLFDIVKPSSRRSCCFTRGYTHLVERSGSILQEAEELDVRAFLSVSNFVYGTNIHCYTQTTETFDEFLDAQKQEVSSCAASLEILAPLRLRYFSPSELLRIFAFEKKDTNDKFVWPEDVSNKSKYKLIGNSVNVRVVEELIRYLLSN